MNEEDKWKNEKRYSWNDMRELELKIINITKKETIQNVNKIIEKEKRKYRKWGIGKVVREGLDELKSQIQKLGEK